MCKILSIILNSVLSSAVKLDVGLMIIHSFWYICFLKVVHSKPQDLIPTQITNEGDPDLQKPDDEEIEEVSLTLVFLVTRLKKKKKKKTNLCMMEV